MATIDDLPIANLSSLSDDELIMMIKNIRARRRDITSEAHMEAKKKAVSKAKKGKPVALKSIDNLTKNITKEQARALIAQLKGE